MTLQLEPTPHTELQRPQEPTPMTFRIDPPRGRAASISRPWFPPARVGHALGERPKSATENAQQGRLERDPSPLASGVLTDETRAACQRRAQSRLVVAELVDTIGARLDPALHGGNPRLANLALARALREAAELWPELAELLEEEIATRRSGRWFSDGDESAAAEWLGPYSAPPAPQPIRAAHSAGYVAAATRVIDRAYSGRPVVPLAYRDPSSNQTHVVEHVPGGDPSAPAFVQEASFLTARIREGHLLGFVPAPGPLRLVPPDITAVEGASWASAPDGACYLLQVTT
jgi:hypothetical protein